MLRALHWLAIWQMQVMQQFVASSLLLLCFQKLPGWVASELCILLFLTLLATVQSRANIYLGTNKGRLECRPPLVL